MKKTLIALAALAATGAVMAQSSVTVYGVVDVGVTSVNNSGAGSTDNSGLTSSNMATNRLGFRGTEDLGGGLKAKFQVETGFNADAPGGTTLGDRGAWIGLEGGFGEVRLGREYSTTFWTGFLYSPFGTGGVGNSFGFAGRSLAYQITGQGNADPAATGSQNGTYNNNSLTYTTPRIAGFMGQVQYVFDEQATGSGGQSTGVRVNYVQGPLSAEVAFSKTDGGQATPTTTAAITGARNLLLGNAGVLATALDHKSTVAGISYDFGVAKVMSSYGQEKANPVGGATSLKMTNFEVGVVAPVGPGRVRAAYTSTKIDSAILAVDPKASKFSVGYIYDLSKRTAMYATVAQLKNKNGLNLALTGPTSTNSANGKSTGYNIGISHTF
ncbi:porin [Aquabacterium sp. A08]|uniref:porin n=1 Tax=Aquabacterium sp. A08 TaxID=2718532 RepID=UPI00141DD8A4|nr:porin [Aquabacterium sp. A08]NIC42353.1 porin [Aquabacterium sp. A08]